MRLLLNNLIAIFKFHSTIYQECYLTTKKENVHV